MKLLERGERSAVGFDERQSSEGERQGEGIEADFAETGFTMCRGREMPEDLGLHDPGHEQEPTKEVACEGDSATERPTSHAGVSPGLGHG